MIEIKTADNEEELNGILALQRKNLEVNITKEEAEKEGFVTVVHTLEILTKMNNIDKSIIAKYEGEVIGYLIAMSPKTKDDVPILVPFFDMIETLTYNNEKINNYLVVGQVCIAKEHRGKGILPQLYSKYKETLCNKYKYAITEISSRNIRSFNAHQRCGFKLIHQFTYSTPISPELWNIILWDWQS